jgi:hypothetical protein
MKMQLPFRAFILAAGVTAMVVMSGCKQGPVDYDKFEERTIDANLAALDSARVLYHAQLAAGNIDAAAEAAYQFLMTQPGVDTAKISADSAVWAFFTSGLLAGTGKLWRDTTRSGRAAMPHEPAVWAASGGEVFNNVHYMIPFPVDLPGTQQEANVTIGILKQRLNWQSSDMHQGSSVDLESVLDLLKNCSSVLYWAGHGSLVAGRIGGSQDTPALVLGNVYHDLKSARDAVIKYAGYLIPGPGQVRQAAVMENDDGTFYIDILPGFISAHADFDGSEEMPGYNYSKTVVLLSTCFSAYSATGGTGPLIQAFQAAGADVVCGYTWAVHDDFACGADTSLMSKMADTCLAYEAYNAVGRKTDYAPIDGGTAEFKFYGDSTVMLRCELQALKDDELYQTCDGGQVMQSDVTVVGGTLHAQGSNDPTDYVSVSFPGTGPGTFDCSAMDDVMIMWTDASSEHNLFAAKDLKGVSGTIQIDSCSGGKVFGSFSGTLGWWDMSHQPSQDPPDQTITIAHGRIKHTGKLGSGKAVEPRGHIVQEMSGALH